MNTADNPVALNDNRQLSTFGRTMPAPGIENQKDGLCSTRDNAADVRVRTLLIWVWLVQLVSRHDWSATVVENCAPGRVASFFLKTEDWQADRNKPLN